MDGSAGARDASSAGGAGGDGGRSVGGSDGGVASGFSWRTLPSLTVGRQNAMGAAVGDTMYVIGGANEAGLLEDVERLNPGQAGCTTAPSLPNPQCCAAVGALGSVIAVAGGYESDGQTPTDALLLLDTTTGVWQFGPPMPTARVNAMGAVWNGKLAVIGGSIRFGSTQLMGVIEIYDPTSNSWAASSLTVTPRASGVAVVDTDGIT